jgi:hypothetical protein
VLSIKLRILSSLLDAPCAQFDNKAVGHTLNAFELARVKGRLTPELRAKLKARRAEVEQLAHNKTHTGHR